MLPSVAHRSYRNPLWSLQIIGCDGRGRHRVDSYLCEPWVKQRWLLERRGAAHNEDLVAAPKSARALDYGLVRP